MQTPESVVDQLLSKPIVVIGAPRSGTSLLSQLLRFHPDVYLANEPRILWKFGNDQRCDALRPVHATPRVREHIRRELANQVKAAGRHRLIEKTPSNSLRVEFVDRVLDDCKFVHILRSGRESVLSIREYWRGHSVGLPKKQLWQRLKEMKASQYPYYAKEFLRRVGQRVVPGLLQPAVWGPRPAGIVEMARDLDLLEVCAWQWRTCVEEASRCGRKLSADRYTEVHLDDLDERQLIQLLAWCELPPSEEVLAEFRRRFRSDAPGGRSQAASDEDLARVDELIAPTNAWLATLPPLCRHRTEG